VKTRFDPGISCAELKSEVDRIDKKIGRPVIGEPYRLRWRNIGGHVEHSRLQTAAAGRLTLVPANGNPRRVRLALKPATTAGEGEVAEVDDGPRASRPHAGQRPAVRGGRIGLPAIFAAFFWLGATSFGGGTAGWLYREIVGRRHWITDAQFLSGAAIGRLMPGSGGVNLTVQVGQLLRGGPGAVAAVLGLLSAPLLIVLALAVGYARVNQSTALHAVLDGIAATAIGLTFATGIKLVDFRLRRAGPLAMTIATVVCVGVLRWPMIPVVLCLAPISVGLALTNRGARV